MGRQRLDAPLPQAVKIPPVVAVGNKIKRAIGRELRLKNRFLAAAGDAARIGRQAVRAQVREPQLGAIPGHVRMIPGKPCQPPAILAQAR
jgi:hypothetical protein